MKSFLEELNPTISLGALLIGAVVFMFSTFSTIKYVDDKHAEAILHSDQNRERMLGIILEVRDSVKTIESRTWEIKQGQSKLRDRKF